MSTEVTVTEESAKPEVVQTPVSPPMPEVSSTDLQQGERIARIEERLQQLSELVESLRSRSESVEATAEFAATLAVGASQQAAEAAEAAEEPSESAPEVVAVETPAPAESEHPGRRPSRWL